MAMWHNGTISEVVQVDATNAGLLLGWGVFTTIGVRAGRAQWLERHLSRLRRDATKCDIEIPYSDEQLREGMNALLETSRIENGLARITATRQDDGRWHKAAGSNWSIQALETDPAKDSELRVSSAPAPFLGELVGVKTTAYLPYFWSWKHAVDGGYDETILFDTAERAIEAARASLFWVVRGQLQTTPLGLGALAGVGREIVLGWAHEHGIDAKECAIRRTDLVWCDEVFLVSAATGPRSIRTLCHDGKEFQLLGETPTFNALKSWWAEQ